MTYTPTNSHPIDQILPFLVPPVVPNQHRLFHGRGGAVAGCDWLTVDCYKPVLLATIYTQQADADVAYLQSALSASMALLECSALVIQHRYGGAARNEVVVGSLPERPMAHEQGLSFLLDFERGQNIGFFADMVAGRQWLAERAQGKSVLNLFSFSCAFSVVAKSAGARQVVNIDLSKPALALGQRNHAINQIGTEGVRFFAHDIFNSWKKLEKLGPYDIIIIDPPSEQKGSFMARKDYIRVIRQLPRFLAPQTEILACLNAPWLEESFLDDVVLNNLEGSERVERLPFAPGYIEQQPQAGLKAVHYRYRKIDGATTEN
jgi:23S rRNA (cytosine1962-C5)-methyltransferase